MKKLLENPLGGGHTCELLVLGKLSTILVDDVLPPLVVVLVVLVVDVLPVVPVVVPVVPPILPVVAILLMGGVKLMLGPAVMEVVVVVVVAPLLLVVGPVPVLPNETPAVLPNEVLGLPKLVVLVVELLIVMPDVPMLLLLLLLLLLILKLVKVGTSVMVDVIVLGWLVLNVLPPDEDGKPDPKVTPPLLLPDVDVLVVVVVLEAEDEGNVDPLAPKLLLLAPNEGPLPLPDAPNELLSNDEPNDDPDVLPKLMLPFKLLLLPVLLPVTPPSEELPAPPLPAANPLPDENEEEPEENEEEPVPEVVGPPKVLISPPVLSVLMSALESIALNVVALGKGILPLSTPILLKISFNL